ncbi:hypothetical protein [Kitasatospora sp. NPDC050543]|uniref:hypothetical protein n=1 Tax=Kitasatospora sp. NPDC050543 TaxID=3364054 RepID=UPI0037B43F2F
MTSSPSSTRPADTASGAETWEELAAQQGGLFRELFDLQRDRPVPAQRQAPS